MPARYCPPVLGGRAQRAEGVKIIDYKKADTQKRVSANSLIHLFIKNPHSQPLRPSHYMSFHL